MCRIWLVTALWCASAVAQAPTAQAPTDVFSKAPPHVDEALRSRVSQFLQAHVDGKFRVANELVAEDSKDFYFTMEKRKFLSFEIVKIDYSDNFTKAVVLSTVEVSWRPSARFPSQRMKPPYKMLWKFENGDWYWYTVNTGEWETPWGKMKSSPEGQAENDPAAAVVEQIRKMDGNAILGQVKASKNEISLKCYEDSTDSIEISNGMQGVVSLRLEGSPVIGLEMKLDRNTLKQGETARLTFTHKPPTKQERQPASTIVHVEPLGHKLEFTINFTLPPEVLKQLPKTR